MTISEATIKLYEWFLKNDSFTESDFINVISISETPDSDRAAVLAALKELETSTILKKISYCSKGSKETDYWILSKKLALLNQSVEISAKTAYYVSEIINRYCQTFKIENETSDPSNVTDKDIQNLIKFSERLAKVFLIDPQSPPRM